MSAAAVALRSSAATSSAATSSTGIHHSPSSTSSPSSPSKMDSKRTKIPTDKARKASPVKESKSTSSKVTSTTSSPKQDPSKLKASNKVTKDLKGATSDAPTDTKTTTTTAPLAPPPRPTNQTDSEYFASSHKNHLSSEPNPFEQSFGNPAAPETPGRSLLPSVASLTSPAPLGTGNASLTGGFGWSGSLRSGPLSPAMISGPQGDYFDNIRSYPTPNESSLRTGLTPGGGGSMFPAPSPGTQALFNSFGGATPGTLDFSRAAVNATTGIKQESIPATSGANNRNSTVAMNASSLAQHPDNEAANGLFMLAQASAPQASMSYGTKGKVGVPNGNTAAAPQPTQDDASEDAKSGTRKSKRASAGKNARRKTEDSTTKPPTKKGKQNNGTSIDKSPDMDDMDSEMEMEMQMEMDMDMPKDTRKMTDEEKRKNFLERNRVAALKCRQRKKQWLQNLQNKVEIYSSENDALNAQVSALRDEVLNLKTILIAHKDCPIAQQQTTSGGYLQHGVDYSNAHYGGAPYGMAMQAQQAVGMAGPRRSS